MTVLLAMILGVVLHQNPALQIVQNHPYASGLHTAPTQNSGWKTVAASGLTIEYPANLKVTSNESAPIVHIIFSNNSALLFISAANLDSSNQDLGAWLRSFDYFKDRYRFQTYESYKRKDGVEVFASFGNAGSYDDAFIRVGPAILYIKNGVNHHTRVREGDFREIMERIKLPSRISVGVPANSGFKCLVEPDALMALYWGTKYRRSNPTVPGIYAAGSYCESSDGSRISTFAYLNNGEGRTQAIVSFDKAGNIVQTYKGDICDTYGDIDSPRILSVKQGMLTLFCLSSDAGDTLFTVCQAPIGTLVPTEVRRGTSLFGTIKKAVEKLYGEAIP